MSQLGDALERPAGAECVRGVQQPVGPRGAQLVSELVLVFIGQWQRELLTQPVEAGLEATQRFLQ